MTCSRYLRIFGVKAFEVEEVLPVCFSNNIVYFAIVRRVAYAYLSVLFQVLFILNLKNLLTGHAVNVSHVNKKHSLPGPYEIVLVCIPGIVPSEKKSCWYYDVLLSRLL